MSLDPFIERRCLTGPGRSIPFKDLRAAYVDFCAESGTTPMTPQMMGRELGRRGFDKSRTSNAFLRLGIELADGSAAVDEKQKFEVPEELSQASDLALGGDLSALSRFQVGSFVVLVALLRQQVTVLANEGLVIRQKFLGKDGKERTRTQPNPLLDQVAKLSDLVGLRATELELTPRSQGKSKREEAEVNAWEWMLKVHREQGS